MLSSDEEVFFDPVDCLSSESSDSGRKEDLVCTNFDYGTWMNLPRSVHQRRKGFLRKMGFVESPARSDMDRITECNGALSSSFSSPEKKLFHTRTMSEEFYSVWASPINRAEENFVCTRSGCEANTTPDEFEEDHSDEVNIQFDGETNGPSSSAKEFKEPQGLVGNELPFSAEEFNEPQGLVEGCSVPSMCKKKKGSWWKRFLMKGKGRKGLDCGSVEVAGPYAETPRVNRMKVKQNKKSCMEFSGVYIGQELHAHEGVIRTMKFSPDGQYLASGGEDGVVRVWRVTSVDSSCKSLTTECSFSCKLKASNSFSVRKKSSHASVVIPNKVFQIHESPVQEFCGHTSDVLDLAWSKSNCLLSSSMDKTVRLWHVDCSNCIDVYYHTNYVTCIQFNPIDENYIISGSIDGKVRIWGVSERRVADWVDAQDVITAICYQPDGKGFIVGSISGTCQFYESSGSQYELDAKIRISKKKNSITGIQFSHDASPKVMITSKGSKVRIFDENGDVHKYKGFRNSGGQISASFTSSGHHIISVGEDSRVYVWNYGGWHLPLFKQSKSVRSCEHFFSEGVSVAIPWSGTETEQKAFSANPRCCSQIQNRRDGTSWIRESERFSLGSWFSKDDLRKCSSATWPEEVLPLWDEPVAGVENHHHQREHVHNNHKHTVPSESWGLVIVTAGVDGTIRTFLNYGLPVRL